VRAEVLEGCVASGNEWNKHMSIDLMIPFVAIVVTAVAAWTDFRKGIIPNWLSLGGLGLGIVMHAVVGFSVDGPKTMLYGALFSVAGALACGLVPLLLYMAGGGRGGDVKLLAAVGAICRTQVGVEAVFYGFLVAAVFAGARLAYEGKLLRTFGNILVIVANPFLPKDRRRVLSTDAMTWTRLGPSVFVGTAVAVLLNWRVP